MTTTRRLDLHLILGLACLTLLYPILGILTSLLGQAAQPVRVVWATSLWAVIGIAWILVVWLTRAPRPLATLVLTGVAGGVLTLLVGLLAQLATAGEAGMLGSPWAILGVLAMHLLGGTICGFIAWGLQSASRGTPRD